MRIQHGGLCVIVLSVCVAAQTATVAHGNQVDQLSQGDQENQAAPDNQENQIIGEQPVDAGRWVQPSLRAGPQGWWVQGCFASCFTHFSLGLYVYSYVHTCGVLSFKCAEETAAAHPLLKCLGYSVSEGHPKSLIQKHLSNDLPTPSISSNLG